MRPVNSPGRGERLEPWRDWALIALGTHAVLVLIAVANPGLGVLLLCALPLGAAFAVGTLTVLHDAGHGMFGKRRWVGGVLVQISTPGGLWAGHWTLKHRMHHKLSQIYPYDEATRSTSVVRLHPGAPSLPRQRYQHLAAWPIYCLAWVGEFRSQLRYLRTGEILGLETPSTRSRWASYLGEKVLWLLLLTPYALRIGVLHMVVLLAVAETVASLLAALVLVVGHINEGLLASSEKPEIGWADNLLRTTASFSTESVVMRWLTGGMTHHLAHHLRPQAVRSQFPELHRTVVQAAGRATGLPVVEFESFPAAIAGHWRRLQALGAPARIDPDLDARESRVADAVSR